MSIRHRHPASINDLAFLEHLVDAQTVLQNDGIALCATCHLALVAPLTPGIVDISALLAPPIAVLMALGLPATARGCRQRIAIDAQEARGVLELVRAQKHRWSLPSHGVVQSRHRPARGGLAQQLHGDPEALLRRRPGVREALLLELQQQCISGLLADGSDVRLLQAPDPGSRAVHVKVLAKFGIPNRRAFGLLLDQRLASRLEGGFGRRLRLTDTEATPTTRG
mmetsp:Transcript_49793/g.142984  ORF Transcript_49793/g.142984 Transcript_49793/m.142984 type:complete len:224 (+) Transcript_49793:34-705(+)